MKAIYTEGFKVGNLTLIKKEGKKYYAKCSCGKDLILGSSEMKTKVNDFVTKQFAAC